MQEAQKVQWLRRSAQSHELRLSKCRRQPPGPTQYLLVDADTNCCVIQTGPWGGVTLDQVEAYLADG